jgi:DNA-binding transcriptional LysR family regulator
MTLEQLRVFVAVAERQHVTRAAEALHMTQSAVSAAIAALEGRHGVNLFHRVGRGIELTDSGRIFLPEARAMIAQSERAELALAELVGLMRGTLRVMASQTIASYWLPRHLVAFRRAHPGITLSLKIGNTTEVAASVTAGAAEIGFVEGKLESDALNERVLAYDQLIIVVASDHPWADRDALKPDDLLETDWVLREEGSGTRSAFESALVASGLNPAALKVALTLPSNEAVRAAVEAGLGATAVSASVAVPSLEAELLRQVSFPLPQRAFSAVWHPERHRSRAASTLLDMIGTPPTAASRDKSK